MNEKAAILDCGGQYTKVIDRKVRELGVYSDIFPVGVKPEELDGYGAVILSGGPSSVYDKNAPLYDERIFDLGKPVLGICYGFHLINKHFGGEVKPKIKHEYGQVSVEIDNETPLFSGLAQRENVLMSHGDSIVALAPGFEITAKTGDVPAAIYNGAKKIAAVQFHPEVDLTENGMLIFENFLRKICGFREIYALEDRIAASVEMIKSRVGDNKVMVLVSGGVDSMVTAALLQKALPAENIHAVHVNHGFMRKNESDVICETLKRLGIKNLHRVDAEEVFLNTKAEIEDGVFAGPLSRVTEPEIKRNIIGRIFIDVLRKKTEELGLDFDKVFVAQGTLRPDLIESGNPEVSSYANKIKTHHNDVDVIRKARAKGLIIETNWDWHKDEVRKVARILGIGEEIAARQPFPGPGLAVRLICSDRSAEVPEANTAQLNEFIKKKTGGGIEGTLAPILSVGVQGDMRSYKNLAVLTGGGMKGMEEAGAEIKRLASEIPNNLDFINRVVYVLNRDSLNQKPLFKSELKMSKENLDLLREIDAAVTGGISEATDKINQYFVVLIPVASAEDKYSAVIRAVVTTDYMTARPAEIGKDLPFGALEKICRKVLAASEKIDMVMYDLTGKPPATVEWE